jgi:hypothetical protein
VLGGARLGEAAACTSIAACRSWFFIVATSKTIHPAASLAA